MSNAVDRRSVVHERRRSGGGESGEGLSNQLSTFALALQAEAGKDAIMTAVVKTAVAHVPGARYAGITLVSDQGQVSTLAKTDDVVAEIDRIQHDTGQGPCLSSTQEHVTVRADDLVSERRWPRFAPAAAHAGVRSMLCLQLLLGDGSSGSLNLMATSPDAFDDQSEDIGLLLGAHAAIALAGADRDEDLIRAEGRLQDALGRERNLAARLNVSDGLRSTVLQTLAHDLRGPIAAVQTYANVLGADLEKDYADEVLSAGSRARRMKMLSGIERSAGMMERLLHDLISSDPHQSIEARRTQCNVGELVARVLAGTDLDQLHPVHRHLTSVVANIDVAQVERIVGNLLNNASTHLDDGVQVWVQTARMGNGVSISVDDAGPGVEPGTREAIFAEFHRGNGGTNPGLGLGLALVSRFAHVHGGRAWVEDRAGGGASFQVYLPDSEPTTPETAEDAAIRVLICDDDPIMADAFEMAIARESDLELVAPAARTGQQAIDAVTEHRPDLVMMDVDLIGPMNGFQATARIRAISPSTTVVIMSGTSDQDGAALKAIEAGASTFLPKTAASRELIPTIRAAAKRRVTSRV